MWYTRLLNKHGFLPGIVGPIAFHGYSSPSWFLQDLFFSFVWLDLSIIKYQDKSNEVNSIKIILQNYLPTLSRNQKLSSKRIKPMKKKGIAEWGDKSCWIRFIREEKISKNPFTIWFDYWYKARRMTVMLTLNFPGDSLWKEADCKRGCQDAQVQGVGT